MLLSGCHCKTETRVARGAALYSRAATRALQEGEVSRSALAEHRAFISPPPTTPGGALHVNDVITQVIMKLCSSYMNMIIEDGSVIVTVSRRNEIFASVFVKDQLYVQKYLELT